jgi:uncharacterized membrane protein
MSDLKMANRSTIDYPQPETLTRGAQALWNIARFPALALLVVLEPLASFLLAGAALLCFLMAFFFKWTGADPRFPFWGMISISIVLSLALLLYEALIALLSRR